MEPMVTVPEPPPPKVRVMPVAKTMLSNSMAMGPKSKVVFPPKKVVVPASKRTPQSLPVQVVTLDLVKVPAITLEPECLMPRSKVNISGSVVPVQTQSTKILVKSPKYTVPVVLSVTKFTTRVVLP